MEKMLFMDEKLSNAVAVLIRELKADPDYRYAWKANIAMAFQDEVHNHPEKTLHQQANDAAEYFLRLLCMDQVTIRDASIRIEGDDLIPMT